MFILVNFQLAARLPLYLCVCLWFIQSCSFWGLKGLFDEKCFISHVYFLQITVAMKQELIVLTHMCKCDDLRDDFTAFITLKSVKVKKIVKIF